MFLRLSHHSVGLAKNACHNSRVESLLVAAVFSDFPTVEQSKKGCNVRCKSPKKHTHIDCYSKQRINSHVAIKSELPSYKATGEEEFLSTKFSRWTVTWGSWIHDYHELCIHTFKIFIQSNSLSFKLKSYMNNLVVSLLFPIFSFNSIWQQTTRDIYLLTFLQMLVSYMCQFIPKRQIDPATKRYHCLPCIVQFRSLKFPTQRFSLHQTKQRLKSNSIASVFC